MRILELNFSFDRLYFDFLLFHEFLYDQWSHVKNGTQAFHKLLQSSVLMLFVFTLCAIEIFKILQVLNADQFDTSVSSIILKQYISNLSGNLRKFMRRIQQ